MIAGLYERLRELFWYGVFGVLTTIINMAAFWLFSDVLSVHYMVANVIAWVIAVAFAYVTNKLWVFESKSWARSVMVSVSMKSCERDSNVLSSFLVP